MQKNQIEITSKELNNLLRIGENDFQDFKSKKAAVKDIIPDIIGFLNTYGGNLYIGIEKDNKTVKGFQRISEAENILGSSFSEITPSPLQYLTHDFLKIDNQYILNLKISESTKIHQNAKGEVYLRIGTNTKKLTSKEVKELQYRIGGSDSYENMPVDNVDISNLTESKVLINFLNNSNIKLSPSEYLGRNEFIFKGKPKVATIICFHEQPQSVSKWGVKILRYETQKNSTQFYKRERLNDREYYLEGDLESLVITSLDSLDKLLKEMKVEYPFLALKEALVNAIIHRDYSVPNDIQIRVYDNLIEIESPGAFPIPLNFGDLNNIPRHLRNPKIVNILFKFSAMKDTRKEKYNQDAGEGIKTIFNEMRKLKLSDPFFENKENSVIITLSHTSAESYEKKIIKYIKENGSIANREARKITGEENHLKIKSIFKKLLNKKKIKKVDPHSSLTKTRYCLYNQDIKDEKSDLEDTLQSTLF